MDSSVVLAMLQTLLTAAAGSNQPTSGNEESPEASGTHARNIVNHLNSGMPLLPGINLFNPIQAKAVQQQLSASSPASASSHAFPPLKPRPIKAKSAIAKQQHSSRGSTSGNDHPMSESNANIGEFSFPGRDEARGQNSEGRAYVAKKQALAGSSAHPASEPMHQAPVRLKHWPAGCLQCGKTESRQWRVKQKRKKALDGTDLDPSMLPDDGHISKLCEGSVVSL